MAMLAEYDKTGMGYVAFGRTFDKNITAPNIYKL